ncbi:hypothetical protein D3C71_276510 [compost metagenome]
MKDRNTIREAVALLAAPVVERKSEGKRERFQKWVLAIEHPVLGFLDGHWLERGDDREGYANEYVQGLWVAYKEFSAPPELAELQATIAQLETKLSNALNLDFERRTEIERLQREEKNDAIAYKAAIEKQAELRAELEHTGHDHYLLRNENGQLQAEIERLKGGQGEPVAYVLYKDGEIDWDQEIIISNTGGDEPNGRFEWRPVYASQPAPVSSINENAAFEDWRKEQIASLVRMGYPDAAKAFRDLGSVQWAGWQARACLDKVKELNT